MKKKNSILGVLVILLSVVVLGLTVFIVYDKFLSKDVNSSGSNGAQNINNDSTSQNSNVASNNLVEYNQETFKKIIDDELYVLFGFKSLSEITNKRKLTLAFNKVEKENTNCNNDVCSTVEYISKEKLEEAFNKTSIAKLGITHESYDVYVLNDHEYVRNQQWMSKRNMFRCGNEASKISDFQVKNNKYIISVKYMFPDTCEGIEKYYGSYSYTDQNESNFITKAYTGSYESNNIEYIDSKKYLDENYDSIKDKLDTYTYTFEVNNGKIELVDFSVKK